MLLLSGIDPGKWYSVKEASAILGFSEDTVIRQVNRDLITALVLPAAEGRRGRRVHLHRRIQGAELIRYIKNHLNRN